jgi:hypothetical protein
VTEEEKRLAAEAAEAEKRVYAEQTWFATATGAFDHQPILLVGREDPLAADLAIRRVPRSPTIGDC